MSESAMQSTSTSSRNVADQQLSNANDVKWTEQDELLLQSMADVEVSFWKWCDAIYNTSVTDFFPSSQDVDSSENDAMEFEDGTSIANRIWNRRLCDQLLTEHRNNWKKHCTSKDNKLLSKEEILESKKD
ncbi:hypothetical protein NHQ30_003367 [Ciborinia camelliae]|nr:hypothetical protein NHQ30_003367 [Ciborinia camelliae]